MVDLNTWILFCIAELALCLSPGPAVLYVFTQGMSRGFKASLAANLGIISGNTIYFVISATGLGALLIASDQLFLFVKWLGAAYLVFIGLKSLFAKTAALKVNKTLPHGLGVTFVNGIVLQLANPKNLVFFLAVLPQFVNPAHPITIQIAILGISSVVIELLVLLTYGSFGSQIERWSRHQYFTQYLEKIAGAALAVIGISLLFISK